MCFDTSTILNLSLQGQQSHPILLQLYFKMALSARDDRKSHPRNSSLKNPPCHGNSKRPSVMVYGYFLELLITRLWGITTEFVGFTPQKLVPRSIVLG